jgi:thiol:disulfide interchange protein DsbD
MLEGRVLTRRLCCLALLAVLGWAQSAAHSDDFLPPTQAFAYSATMAAPATLQVYFRIAPGYYLYRERFGFALSPLGAATLGKPDLPKGEVKYDPTFDKSMEVYHESVTLRIPINPGGQPFILTVTSQGCADAGLCYPPMDSKVKLRPMADGYVIDDGDDLTAKGLSWQTLATTNERGLAAAIGGLGWLKTAGVFLLLGVLLALTPCVLPMIPIVSAIVVGGHTRQQLGRWRGLGLAAAYVFGMSVVYTLLGVAAGLSGAGFAAWLQTPWVLGAFAILLALLALAMFDAFTFQMPGIVQAKLAARAARVSSGRVAGAVTLGALSGLIIGPCVAAPLAGALLYISQTGDVLLGGSALFALAWGMGLPLLILGASSGALLPKAGAWMEGVKRLFGMLLLATAWWMLIPVVPVWLQMGGWAFLAIVSAVMLGAFEALRPGTSTAHMFAKGTGLLLALASVAWLAGVASGGRDVLQPIAHWVCHQAPPAKSAPAFTRVSNLAGLEAALAQSSRPVMLDFYADWCVACREMERLTLNDPEVTQRMAGMLLLRADVTAANAEDRALLKRFGLFGPPAILFFEPGGKEIVNARVVGFQNAQRFTATLNGVVDR